MARTIGIDLGTTNSVVAYIDGTRIETIANTEGSKLTPSCVYYKSDEEIIVGELAKRQFLATPQQCVRSIKRIMGKRYDELVEEMEDLPYTIVRLDDGMAGVELEGGVRLRPEEVSADILDKMRQTAEIFLNEDVTDAVITVPAHFNDQQRTATKVAAEMAGLNVLRIINEPTAAALAYGVGRDEGGIVAVFDFGGGTFDMSILQISSDIYEVLSTNGDNHLGGDDIDLKLYQDICDTILQDHGIDPTQDIRAVQRIREAAEKAKCELSSLNSTMISLPFIVADSKGPKHYERELTRARFNEMMEPLFVRLFEPCRRAVADANLRVDQIKEILLVGGSTRIPRVQELVAEFFGKQPNRTVNPDEAVSAGAAVQSGVITGALREVLLLDVTPLTLGIELAGGVFKALIPRNSTIPCEASRKFTTVVDNQTSVLVHVLQGERAIATENHSLAQFRLTGLPPAPKDLLEIEVHFSIDANGILSVAATELTTGQMTGVLVENYGEIGTRREEIDRLVQSAKKHADEDDRFRRFADRSQNAERIQDKANKLINAAGDMLSSEKIKVLKETMLRVDLAIAAMNDKELGQHETKLRDLLLEYEQDAELQRAISRSLNEANQRSSQQNVQGMRVAQADLRTETGIDEAVPQAAAKVVMARGGAVVGGAPKDGEPSAMGGGMSAAGMPGITPAAPAASPAARTGEAPAAPPPKAAAHPPPAAKLPEPEPEPEAPAESTGEHEEGDGPRFQLRVRFDDDDDGESSFDPSNMPLPPGGR